MRFTYDVLEARWRPSSGPPYLGKYSLEELDELVDLAVDSVRADGIVFERIDTGLRTSGAFELPHDMADTDPKLKGFWGIHVGDPYEWAGILGADDYLDTDRDAPIYEIRVGEPREEGGRDPFPVYVTDDPHPTDKGETPASQIVFAPSKTLPLRMYKRTGVIRPKELRALTAETWNAREGGVPDLKIQWCDVIADAWNEVVEENGQPADRDEALDFAGEVVDAIPYPWDQNGDDITPAAVLRSVGRMGLFR